MLGEVDKEKVRLGELFNYSTCSYFTRSSGLRGSKKLVPSGMYLQVSGQNRTKIVSTYLFTKIRKLYLWHIILVQVA